jgi:pimeloyl-ACP methyl ester carboxylesterase
VGSRAPDGDRGFLDVESIVPLHASAATCALMPGGQFVVVEECGHFPWLERPGSVRGAIETFLAR